MRIGRTAILPSLLLPVWLGSAPATDQEISSQRQMAENALGVSSLFLSVVNIEGSGKSRHALGWSLAGMGAGFASIVVSSSREGEAPTFGMAAGSLAVATAFVRLVRTSTAHAPAADAQPGGHAAGPAPIRVAVGWRRVGVRASF